MPKMLEAFLEERAGDVPLPEENLLRLTLVERLEQGRRDKLLNYPGALRLRWFQEGDAICQQGAEDCTAFFVLHGIDHLRIRDALKKYAGEVPEANGEVAEALEHVEAVLRSFPADKRQRLEEAHQAAETIFRRRQGQVELQEGSKQHRVQTDAELKKLHKELEGTDKPRADALKPILAAKAPKKREEAAKLEADAPDLAALLRTAADAEELETKAKQEAESLWKEYAQLTTGVCAAPDLFADVELLLANQKAAVASGSLWQRFKQSLFGKATQGDTPFSLPSDAPREINFRTRHATIDEGEVFGEMACLNRRPRSATVRATRPGFVLEMLSNILAEIDKDANYKAQRNEEYRTRVLDLHLRDLSIFRDLTDEQLAQVFAIIRDQAELVTYTSGQLICDEHERSDCMYLVREGIVQIKKNVSALLQVADVLDWAKLGQEARKDRSPFAAVVRLLPEAMRTVLATADLATLPAAQQRELIYALNDVIKNPKLVDTPECKVVVTSELFRLRSQDLPAKAIDRTETEQRRFQRLLLEQLLPPDIVRTYQKPVGAGLTLTYRSRGEFIGEMGLLKDQPRVATCLAFGQPRNQASVEEQPRLTFRCESRSEPSEIRFGLPEVGEAASAPARVEMVRLSKALFDQLIDTVPVLRERIAQEVDRRETYNRRIFERSNPAELGAGLTSEQASRLGLIQGQRLMLIDLERCTRCNECVKACMDAHPDDGHARLHLFGPRFGKYLVPTSCRSCLDPVCMVDCPVRAIQRGDNQEMQIKDWCIGCNKCAKQCPYGSIQMHNLDPTEPVNRSEDEVEVKTRAVVCDMCSSTPSQQPSCVYACPHNAAFRVDAQTEFPLG